MSGNPIDRRMSINDVNLPSDLVKKQSIAALKELLQQDEATFFEYFEGLNLADVKMVREKIQKIRDSNRDLAVKNLELEPKLEEVKTQLVERCVQLRLLREEYDKNFMKLKVFESKKSHQTIEKELSMASRKTEQESEEFAANFIGGNSSLTLDDFSKSFIQLRTLYWLRKVKAEKMKEFMVNYRPTPLPRTNIPSTSATNSISSTPSLYSLPPQHTHSTGHLPDSMATIPPYPIQGGMPQPQAASFPFPAAAYRQPVPCAAARQRPPGPVPPYSGQYRLSQQQRF